MKHRAVCWYAEGQTLEFGVELGEYFGVVWVVLAYSSAYCRSDPARSRASRRTFASGPGSRASLSGSCAGAS
jgi:hypothetical protein